MFKEGYYLSQVLRIINYWGKKEKQTIKKIEEVPEGSFRVQCWSLTGEGDAGTRISQFCSHHKNSWSRQELLTHTKSKGEISTRSKT